MTPHIMLMYPPHGEEVLYLTSIPSLSSYLQDLGYIVNICNHNEYKDIINYIKNNKPMAFGISIPFTYMAYNARTLILMLKTEFPDVPIIVGGVHPTLCPEDFDDVNVCIGEGEETLKEFLYAILTKGDLKEIAGLYGNKEREFMDLNTIDLPDWKTKPQTTLTNGMKAIPYSSSRGCPYNCGFCSNWILSKHRIRYRSISNTINDLKTLKEKFNTDVFDFRDETFTVDKQRVKDFCKALLCENIKIKWWCQTRANLVDEDTLKLMKSAGCIGISMGIESGDTKVLKKINKGITLKQARHSVNLIKQAGLMSYTGFMLGHPWDDEQSVRNTIDFAEELDADAVGFSITCPYPKTKIREIAEVEGGILTNDYSKYKSNHVVYIPPKLKGHDMKKLKEHAERYFYSRNIKRIYSQFKRMFFQKGWKPKAHFMILLVKSYFPYWIKWKMMEYIAYKMYADEWRNGI